MRLKELNRSICPARDHPCLPLVATAKVISNTQKSTTRGWLRANQSRELATFSHPYTRDSSACPATPTELHTTGFTASARRTGINLPSQHTETHTHTQRRCAHWPIIPTHNHTADQTHTPTSWHLTPINCSLLWKLSLVLPLCTAAASETTDRGPKLLL